MSDIEFLSTRELLDEVISRHEAFVYAGVTEADSSLGEGESAVLMGGGGDPLLMLGLTEALQQDIAGGIRGRMDEV